MGGGLIQLIAVGIQDKYLIGNPQITFFKLVYRKHTNFCIESRKQDINGIPDFGKSFVSKLSKEGDLIHKMYFEIKLPAVTFINGTEHATPAERYDNWTNSIGYAMLKEVSICIGGKEIDKHYSEWLDIWNELTDTNNKEWDMVGKKGDLYDLRNKQNNKTIYYVPLQFWFNRHTGMSLPLISLQYSDVEIKFTLRELSELIVTSRTTPTITANTTIDNLDLYADYIYLDTEERRRFAKSKHEYLIEQIQHQSFEFNTSGNYSFKLDFSHPVKELIWVFRDNNHGTVDDTPLLNLTSSAINGNDWFNYQGSVENTDNYIVGNNNSRFDNFNTVNISFNNSARFSEREASYFSEVQPYQHHSSIPSNYVYCYSFSLNPEEIQPSGTCNFSRIDSKELNFKGCVVPSSGVTSSTLLVYAVNYNILQFSNGMAITKFI